MGCPHLACSGDENCCQQREVKQIYISDDPKTWEDGLRRVMDELFKLMVERHRKYGPENINASGILGLLVRSMDKMARIKEGMKDVTITDADIERDYPDEAFDDAWMDLSCYTGPIYMMLMRGWWDLPMEKEEPEWNDVYNSGTIYITSDGGKPEMYSLSRLGDNGGVPRPDPGFNKGKTCE